MRKAQELAITKPDILAGYSLFYESATYGGDFLTAIENNRDFTGQRKILVGKIILELIRGTGRREDGL